MNFYFSLTFIPEVGDSVELDKFWTVDVKGKTCLCCLVAFQQVITIIFDVSNFCVMLAKRNNIPLVSTTADISLFNDCILQTIIVFVSSFFFFFFLQITFFFFFLQITFKKIPDEVKREQQLK